MRRMLSVAVAAAIASLIVIPVAAAWAWPADGPVLRPFSVAEDRYAAGQHRGIDIGAAVGAPVRAPAAGTVSFAGPVPGGGRAVTILTADGYAITLLQLGSTVVAPGGVVTEGTVVGQVGESEDAVTRASHVHLGIRVAADPNGYVDPASLLPARLPVTAPEPMPWRRRSLRQRCLPWPSLCRRPFRRRPSPRCRPRSSKPARRRRTRSRPGRWPPSRRVEARRPVSRLPPTARRKHDREPRSQRRPAARAPAARPVAVRRDRDAQRRLEGARAPTPLPNRARRRQQRLRRRRLPIGQPRAFDGVVGPADPHDAIRPAPASVRESAAGGDGRPRAAVAPARRGGGRGWAHGRGRPQGCAYH